jgi:aldehyde:ferredoxin oxidoreductase
MKGLMGKILRVDLANRRVSTIDTNDYADWVGGHGIGSALFWDLVADKAITGFDPRNALVLMTSPLAGTLVPSASARVEMVGVGTQSYPVEWFTRSNLGGRFGAMLKFAGWDGIVLEGNADAPVWVDIRDDRVAIKDARGLWGLDCWETQSLLWKEVSGRDDFGRVWTQVGDQRWTTQRPAVLVIGQAGEKLSRVSCIMHEKGHAFGQGGFGAVWGHKKLKAISVIGTKSVPIADPGGLMKAWRWAQQRYSKWPREPFGQASSNFAPAWTMPVFWPPKKEARPKACYGCFSGCHAVYADGKGSEGKCLPTLMYLSADMAKHGKVTDASYLAVDTLNRYGLNSWEVNLGMRYVKALYDMGELGPGRKINGDLPFDKYGESEFADQYMETVVDRRGIGDDLSEGLVRAAKRWGRVERDLRTGLLDCAYWGYPNHYDPRAQADWGLSSIVGDRDCNEHEVNWLFWLATSPPLPWFEGKGQRLVAAEDAVRILSKKVSPQSSDPAMLDCSEENIYSESMAKLVSWHRHFTRFWRESALFCDFRWSEAVNTYAPGNSGVLAEAEEPFFAAVTGKKVTIAEGVELGRKIWNLDNAVWTLQGRHRDMVQFPEYIYSVPLPPDWPQFLPGREKGQWKYIQVNGRHLDKQKFEEWKTKFYHLEGWDTETGWPTRETLKDVGLGNVAEELEKRGKLGRA